MNINMQNMSQLMNLMQGNSNPEDFVYNLVSQRMGGNPFFMNLLTLAQSGRGNEIEEIARNVMKEQGQDFDKEFNDFRHTFGL